MRVGRFALAARVCSGPHWTSFPLRRVARCPNCYPTSMKMLLPFSIVAALTAFTTSSAAATDTRCYEMLIYYAAPGKLDALNTRFREHTCKLFEKHGMVNICYWVPMTNAANKLAYLLSYPSREAREKSWKDFMADPDWQAASKASEKDAKLV